jgi:hypothetical protein
LSPFPQPGFEASVASVGGGDDCGGGGGGGEATGGDEVGGGCDVVGVGGGDDGFGGGCGGGAGVGFGDGVEGCGDVVGPELCEPCVAEGAATRAAASCVGDVW